MPLTPKGEYAGTIHFKLDALVHIALHYTVQG
jgi:hypothetical protein